MRIYKFIALVPLTFLVSCSQQDKNIIVKDSESVIAIKEARKSSNLALQNRDSIAFAATWMENFQILSSRDNEVRGKEENMKSFGSMMNTDAVYVRTPDKIHVMEQWGMASEYGTWIGNLTVDGDAIEIEGDYYAKWHRIDRRWLLRTEVYTPLNCKGGAYCNNRPVNN